MNTLLSSVLAGQRIAIFGGSSGIGLALASILGQARAHVTIIARTASSLESGMERLQEQAAGKVIDARDEDAVADFFATHEGFDHVISTVGIPSRPVKILETRREDVEDHFQLKYWGQFFVMKHAAKKLRPGGSLILTTGISPARPVVGYACHGAISAALESLVRTLALELAPLRVNAVCPGVIETEKLFAELPAEAHISRVRSESVPTNRLGLPEDAAHTYLFALTNPHLTGQILVVDGGSSLR